MILMLHSITSPLERYYLYVNHILDAPFFVNWYVLQKHKDEDILVPFMTIVALSQKPPLHITPEDMLKDTEPMKTIIKNADEVLQVFFLRFMPGKRSEILQQPPSFKDILKKGSTFLPTIPAIELHHYMSITEPPTAADHQGLAERNLYLILEKDLLAAAKYNKDKKFVDNRFTIDKDFLAAMAELEQIKQKQQQSSDLAQNLLQLNGDLSGLLAAL